MINNTYYLNNTMKIKHIITEAKGLFGRLPGDKFVHTDGREAEFVRIDYYPDPAIAQFESPQERDDVIKQYEDDIKTKIEWVNQPGSSLGFAVAVLNNREGGVMLWGRYLQKTKHNMMTIWSNKHIPAGWSLATKGAKKLQVGYDPQNLIKTANVFMTTAQVIATVGRNAPPEVAPALTDILYGLATGQPRTVFKGMADQMEALRDYFGEIMQPLALEGGIILGQAEDARKLLADGASWNNCKMRWPMGMNAALCDSFLIAPNGQEIGISSKGGAGAKASAKNLHDAYLIAKKKAEKDGNTELIETAKYCITIVKVIAEQTAKAGPIILGKMLQIPGVDETLGAEIDNYINTGKRDFEGISQASANLLSGFKVNNDVRGFNTGYAIMAAVAKTVAKEINKNPEFAKGAIALLNQSNIIQVYTNMVKQGEDAVLKDFRAVYPPNFEGQIKVDGGKELLLI
jgi:hypothetical protein